MTRAKPIVAIDGPVGVGKSTVAALLAVRLGFIYIDTGAMYRAVTLKVMRRKIDPTDITTVAKIANQTDLQFKRIDGALRIFCDGEDVSDAIRTPEVSAATSPIADNVAVRERLVALQQQMGLEGGVVMEGRDIGTVVFPDAEIKIYLDADPKVRAGRRYKELIAIGRPVTLEETYKSLLERDRRDRERPVGALKVAEGAVVFDSTFLSQDAVIEALYQLVAGEK